MRHSPVLVLLSFASVLGASASAQSCVWGSFDTTRLLNSHSLLIGPLTGYLRAEIAEHGGVVGPITPTLTPEYLSTVDVFFTSRLADGADLSSSEQAALQAWLAGGGTLFVSVGTFGHAAYESFTQPYGVGGYSTVTGFGIGHPIGSHPITAGVVDIRHMNVTTFGHGGNARLLAKASGNQNFIVVLEPQTGFTSGGRIVVVGDYDTLTDSLVPQNDNAVLLDNLVDWACEAAPTPCPGLEPSWENYGSGWPGTNGVPSLTSGSDPYIGGPVDLTLGNSWGTSTVGYLLIGAAPAVTPTALGGTILVALSPSLVVEVPVFPIGMKVSGKLPADPTLCGQSLHLQLLEVDPGASHGVSFSPGLRLTLGG